MDKTFENEELKQHLRETGAGNFTQPGKTLLGNGHQYIVTGRFDSGIVNKERSFESGSKRDDDSNKPLTNHLLGYTRIRFGYRLRSGATKYGKGNWRLGQPEETIEESTDRHWAQWLDGDRSEDHLAAVMFGLNQLMLKDKEAGIPADHYFKPL